MTAPRAATAALLALALLLPAASASSATVTDASGDATDASGNPAPHLDVLQVEAASSSGAVTLTISLDDLDVSQAASYYGYRLAHGGVEYLWYCNVHGDGAQIVAGSCGIQATALAFQAEGSLLRSLPVVGPFLAILLDSLLWDDLEHLAGSTSSVPVTIAADASSDTLSFSATASDLGLSSGDALDLLGGGSSDCSLAACPTADTLGGGASVTVE